MIIPVRRWLAKVLHRGLWFPGFTRLVQLMSDKLSLGVRFKRWLAQGQANPPGASELYQVIWLFVLAVWLALVDVRVEWASTAAVRYFGVAVVGYRVFEIAIFCLSWVFASAGETLHSARRSIAMLFVNLIEIALATSVAVLMIGCASQSPLSTLYAHLSAAFSMGPPAHNAGIACSIASHGQLVASYLIVFVLLGSLIGAIIRKDKRSNV